MVKTGESVALLPVDASPSPDGKTWDVPVRGWIYQVKDDSRVEQALRAVRVLLNAPEMGDTGAVFQQRLKLFFADSKPDRAIPLQVAGKSYRLATSDNTGHFNDTVKVPASAVAAPINAADAGWLDYSTSECGKGGEVFTGRAQLLEKTGLSVVSSIDDTLTTNAARSPQSQLVQMLFRRYEPEPGMAELFRNWKNQGARFHYVSGSPSQLYPVFAQFLSSEGFPDGSVGLQTFQIPHAKELSGLGLLDAFLNLLDNTQRFKPEYVSGLVEKFPNRQFILVGSAAQKDPETFGELARRYPERVKHVYIRGDADKPEKERFEKAFRGVPADRWEIFTDATTLRG
jgi:phosphatidate phosphatase APP1